MLVPKALSRSRALVNPLLKRVLKSQPSLYGFARSVYRRAYQLPFARRRTVTLSRKMLASTCIKTIQNNTHYNDVINDLVAYTGFPIEKLEPYILRHPEKHFESEFKWFQPNDRLELAWFYRCSSAYLFGNCAHAYQSKLDVIKQGSVLDYGAGAGCNTIGLAKRGINVDFSEISRLQADFINFRAIRHGLNNVKEILPYHHGRFDPVSCIEKSYDAIVAMDVLEHIPDYHVVVRHFINRLNPSGLIIENSPFDLTADDIAIHVRPSVPIEQAMDGMEKIDKGIWKKRE